VVAVVAAAGVVWLARDRAPAPASGPLTIGLAGFDPAGLTPDERWLADAMTARLRDELDDAWAIELVDADRADLQVAGKIRRDAAGRLVVDVAIGTDPPRPWSGGSIDELAAQIARALAERQPVASRHPTAGELTLVGARDPEAWRQWRRAQRHGRMQRWHRDRALTSDALARDPGFPLARIELAFSYERVDAAMLEVLRPMQPPGPGLAPPWRRAVEFSLAFLAGDTNAPDVGLQEMLAMPLGDRDRLWLETRFGLGVYALGQIDQALAVMERTGDRWPRDAAAARFLAEHHVLSDQERSAAIAVEHAAAAVERSPDDIASRALYALALARTGRVDDARAEARRIAHGDADQKREAGRLLCFMYLALDQPDEAEVAVRRLTTGSAMEQLQAARLLGALDLYRGRLDPGFAAIDRATAAYAAAGRQRLSYDGRAEAALDALALGDRDRATRLLQPMAATPRGAALLAIADGRPRAAAQVAADAALAQVPAGDAHDALAIIVDVELERTAAAIARFKRRGGEVAIDGLAAMAAAYQQAGDAGEEARLLARLVAHPEGWRRPVAVVRAHLRLGVLAEARGDRAAARAAYQVVLGRWERAAGDRPEVATARARLAALAGT
jgi:hypothetical protein